MTRNNQPNHVKWTIEHDLTFKQLKEDLVSVPVFWNPDFNAEIILQTDASDMGLGVVLLLEKEAEHHPIVYLSKKLQPREHFPTVEKESYAIEWAIKRLTKVSICMAKNLL